MCLRFEAGGLVVGLSICLYVCVCLFVWLFVDWCVSLFHWLVRGLCLRALVVFWHIVTHDTAGVLVHTFLLHFGDPWTPL